MNLANPKRILPIYLICLLPDIFVHFHNTVLNLLIYSINIIIVYGFCQDIFKFDFLNFVRKNAFKLCSILQKNTTLPLKIFSFMI